jgi:hypothetical protein
MVRQLREGLVRDLRQVLGGQQQQAQQQQQQQAQQLAGLMAALPGAAQRAGGAPLPWLAGRQLAPAGAVPASQLQAWQAQMARPPATQLALQGLPQGLVLQQPGGGMAAFLPGLQAAAAAAAAAQQQQQPPQQQQPRKQ